MNNEKTREDIYLRRYLEAIVEGVERSEAIIKKAKALALFWNFQEIRFEAEDVLVGHFEINDVWMYPKNLADEIKHLNMENEKEDYNWVLIAEKIGLFTRTPGAHVVPGYDSMLKEGLQNRIERVIRTSKDCSQDQRAFYQAEIIVLYGLQNNILRHGKVAGEKGNKRLQEVCKRIAYHAPSTFLEAVQMVWMLHKSVVEEAGSGSISFGRIDQYLYPYYKRDIEKGRLTQNNAQKIINALWIRIAELEKSWQNITIGGGTVTGENQCNELSMMCMEAAMIVCGDQPQLSLRVSDNMPDCYWNKAMELIKTGMGFPELYNDNIAVKAKQNVGVSKEDAWNYSIVGCVEISVGGKEYSHMEGARFNWMKILEIMLNKGKCSLTGIQWELKNNYNLDSIQTFDEFYNWYKEELMYFLRRVCEFIDRASQNYGLYWPVPYTSALMEGCIEKGRDVTNGGTVYNNLTVNCVGIASVADALEAIEQLVFRDKVVSLVELSDILCKDFADNEWLQEKMLACPKYGNDIVSVDLKVKDLVKTFTETLQSQKMKYGDGRFQAGFYTSYFHATLGALTGATADGRKARTALSSSLSPMAGMDQNGPTAVINSANKIDMSYMGNGMVLDLKFLSGFFDKEERREIFRWLVEEYFAQGGMEIQFNTINREELLDAQIRPWIHKNLIVRVSGFSAYFISLEKVLQDEIIQRTEHQGMI